MGTSTIPSRKWRLVSDLSFYTGHRQKTYVPSGASVGLRIYAGVNQSNPSDAGWYVICNGRLILSADKSETTGWGWRVVGLTEGDGVPRYHNQFARFRGYVLFDSDDGSQLPWNTTKTGVDPDNSLWLDAREEMSRLMRPVIDFLNVLDVESGLPESEKVLTLAVGRASMRPLSEIVRQGNFHYPPNPRPRGPKRVSIQFSKDEDRVEELREAMGKNSARATGDAAFEDAYGRYVGEE